MKKAAHIFVCLSFACVLANCNLAYEEISGNICTTLHPVKPISKEIQVTDVCHGESFRFPSNYCTEVNCHGPDLKGGNSGAPSCYKCHGDKWTLFSTTHTLKLGGYYHDPWSTWAISTPAATELPATVPALPRPAFPGTAIPACCATILSHRPATGRAWMEFGTI